MSDMSTLRDNIELILAHREEIQTYPPYKFSRLVIRSPRRLLGSWYHQNMFMGAYVDVWHHYLQKYPGQGVLPLHILSGQFGTVYQFLGLSMTERQLVKKKPDYMGMGDMRDLMWKFVQSNPADGLGVPLSQMVEELKQGKPQEERESFKLVTLRDDFYRSLETVSGIQPKGESDLEFSLGQRVSHRLFIYVKARVNIELTEEEKAQLKYGGSVAELDEMLLKTREDLISLSRKAGFRHAWVENSGIKSETINFAKEMPSADYVLHTDTIAALSDMLHAMRKRMHRL